MRAVTFKPTVLALSLPVEKWVGGDSKSWPSGDLGDLYSFFAWRTGRARFGDISSFKEHGTAE